MNSESTTPVQTALMTSRPPVVISLLRILMAVGAGITILLGVLAYSDLLTNKDYVIYAGALTAILLPLKNGIEAAGDLLDDGVRNNSFKLGLLFLCFLPLASCSTVGMSDNKLAWAKTGMEAAQMTVAIAGAQLLAVMSKPDTPTWQIAAAQKGLELASKQLAAAEAKYQAEQDLRATKVNQVVLDLTSGK